MKELMEIIKKHPNKKVVFMVQSEVVESEELEWWRGCLGDVTLDEVYTGLGGTYLRSENWDELLERIKKDIYNTWDIGIIISNGIEVLADEEIRKLPWKEVIVAKITI